MDGPVGGQHGGLASCLNVSLEQSAFSVCLFTHTSTFIEAGITPDSYCLVTSFAHLVLHLGYFFMLTKCF